jgi:hypothetical protein
MPPRRQPRAGGPADHWESKMRRSIPKTRGFFLKVGVVAAALAAGAVALADLTPWKDYTISDSIQYITTVKVEPNMEDVYLEGLKSTWVPTMEVAKKLGQIEDYRIYASSTPQSGDFNLMLVVKYKNAAAAAPNKERFEAFMKEFGEARSKQTTEHAQKAYPAIRKITGDYMMREITLK